MNDVHFIEIERAVVPIRRSLVSPEVARKLEEEWNKKLEDEISKMLGLIFGDDDTDCC